MNVKVILVKTFAILFFVFLGVIAFSATSMVEVPCYENGIVVGTSTIDGKMVTMVMLSDSSVRTKYYSMSDSLNDRVQIDVGNKFKFEFMGNIFRK